MKTPIIEIKNLTKKYNGLTAVVIVIGAYAFKKMKA